MSVARGGPPLGRRGALAWLRSGLVVGLLGLFVVLVLASRPAAAAKVIPADHEPRVRAVLAPYTIGGAIDEVVVHSLQIDRDRAVIRLVGANELEGTLTLAPRELDDPDASESFSFTYVGAAELEPAANQLAAAVRRNDRGDVYLELDDPPPPQAEGEDEGVLESLVEPGQWTAGARARYLAWIGAGVLVGLGLVVGWRRRPRAPAHRRPAWTDELVAGLAILAAVTAAGAYAWVCDDATISMRYAWQLVHGHGLVFNVGERVQGFSNPLWTLALAAGPVDRAPDVWAIGMGLMATTASLLLLWACVLELRLRHPGAWFAALVALLFACQPVLAFSTSGLEGSATHMFVSACLLACLRGHANTVMVVAALALVNRLDTALLLAPMVVSTWRRSAPGLAERWRACRGGLVAAVGLLAAWFGFATLYFGYPLPNTWYAKGSLQLVTGVAYLADFARHRWGSIVILLGGPILVLRREADPVLRGAAVGVLLQLAYVVSVGGDYMHGRFLTAPMLVAGLASVAALARTDLTAEVRPRWPSLAVVALVGLTGIDLVRPPPRGGPVVVEREAENAVWATGFRVIGTEAVARRADGTPIPERQVISNHLIGQVYGTPPSVEWIDGYGLTDPYVARCPPVPGSTRPGHVERQVPRAYLRARGDLRQLVDGRARVEAGDPSVWAEVEAMRASPGWPSEEHRIVYEELQLLTRAPLFDPRRLRTIPRYLIGRRRLPAIPDAQRFDIVAPDPG